MACRVVKRLHGMVLAVPQLVSPSSLFKLHPEVKVLFGLADLESEELLASGRFKLQAKYMIQMLDTSLQVRTPVSLTTLFFLSTLTNDILDRCLDLILSY